MKLIAEQILSKILPEINWLTGIDHPLKISIRFFLSYSARFVPGFAVNNSQIPMNRRNSPKSVSGTLIILLLSTRMTSTKKIRQEEEKIYELSQDTDELFIHPIKYRCISSTACCPPRVYTIPTPSIFIDWLISITCSTFFVLRFCKYIIIDFIDIFQKSMYILSSH